MADEPIDNLVVNNTLGIGTNEPAAQLHVVSSEGISSKVFVASINGSLLQVTAEPNNASIGTATSHALNINTNGLPRIQISSEGNVGIGTDTTPANLQVKGNVTANAFSGNGTTLSGLVKQAGDTMTGPLTVQANLSVTGNVGVGTPPGTDAKLTVNGTVKATAFQGDGSQVTGKVSTSGDTMTGPLTIQANLSISGNVGIGTTTTNAKLNIFHEFQGANGNTLILGPTDASNLRLGYHAEYSWIQSHGGKSLAINPIGNYVGIGTNSPRTKLEVYGGRLRVSTSDTNSAGVIELSNGSKTNYVFTDGSTGDLFLRTDSPNHDLILQEGGSQGKVGIGTPDPKAKLHVVGDLLGAAKGSGGEAFRIVVGQTPVGATNWVQFGTDGIYVDIDTSTAGFSSVLLYLTSIGGSGHHWATQGATSIYNQTATSFRVYVLRPGIAAAQAAKEWYWHINWIAIGN